MGARFEIHRFADGKLQAPWGNLRAVNKALLLLDVLPWMAIAYRLGFGVEGLGLGFRV